MSDDRPDLTKTEMRQGNSRRMNLRVLIIGVVVVAIGFALAIWYNSSVTPETDTTTPAGETVEETPPADGSPAVNLDEGALPIPAEEPAPATEEPAPAPVEEEAPAIEEAPPVIEEPAAEEPAAQ